jgi:hypothetical protein
VANSVHPGAYCVLRCCLHGFALRAGRTRAPVPGRLGQRGGNIVAAAASPSWSEEDGGSGASPDPYTSGSNSDSDTASASGGDGLLGLPLLVASRLSHINKQYIKVRRA